MRMQTFIRQVLSIILFTATAALAASQPRQGRSDAVAALKGFVKSMDTFCTNFPQEKVYLHLDNTGYFRGETIWFKAYAVRSDDNSRTDISKVLYVELLNPFGEVMATRKLNISDGQASGSIRLDSILIGGFYEIRAYTRYMLNWGSSGMFTRVVPIYDIRHDGRVKDATEEVQHRKRYPEQRKQAEKVPADRRVRFYPEGGHLIKGLRCRVVFEVTGANGEGVDASGTLKIPGGNTLPISTQREGRGTFVYTPSDIPASIEVCDSAGKTYRGTLPAAEGSGCAMLVNTADSSDIGISILRTPDIDDTVGLVAINGGSIVAFDAFRFDGQGKEMRIKRADMPEGVSQLALLTADGDILAERMVFVYPDSTATGIDVTNDGAAITPYGKICLDLTAPPLSNLSVSVRDHGSDINGTYGNAATWLLLGSELKGYIRNPEYYLESDDATHRRAADLLMLTQGWRKYNMRQMAGLEPFAKKHPAEDGLYIYGRLKPKGKLQATDGNGSLRMTIYNKVGKSLSGTARTDSAGYYAFAIPDCTDSWQLLLDAGTANTAICIDRNFSPEPRAYSVYETRTLPVSGCRQLSSRLTELTGKAADVTDPYTIKEVTVKGRRPFENAREAWESEKRGAWHSYVRYDCGKETERILDEGDDIPEIFEWLKRRNGFFQGGTDNVDGYAGYMFDNDSLIIPEGGEHVYIIPYDGLSYKNRPVVWILNNCFHCVTSAPQSVKGTSVEHIFDESNEMMPYTLDELKSVYISENETAWRRFVSIERLDAYSPVTVFLYSRHTFPATRKGTRRTTFDGYSKIETFDSPDYSVMTPVPDRRRTLYWNPDVATDRHGHARIEFYNNATCRQITVSAEGMTKDGRCLVNGSGSTYGQ